MGKHDLGNVALYPWSDFYNLYTTKPKNFNGSGGYKIVDERVYVALKGTATGNISLPYGVGDINYVVGNKTFHKLVMDGIQANSGDTVYGVFEYEVR